MLKIVVAIVVLTGAGMMLLGWIGRRGFRRLHPDQEPPASSRRSFGVQESFVAHPPPDIPAGDPWVH